jgi:hypothetical protein
MLEQVGVGRNWIAGPLELPHGRGINFQVAVPDIEPILAAFDWLRPGGSQSRLARMSLSARSISGSPGTGGSCRAPARAVSDDAVADVVPSGRGRASIRADGIASVLVLSVLVLQTIHNLPDRETADAVTFDLRCKAARGFALSQTAFHPSVLTFAYSRIDVLTYWRRRLAGSDRPPALAAVTEVINQSRGVDRAVPPGGGLDDPRRRGRPAVHRHPAGRADPPGRPFQARPLPRSGEEQRLVATGAAGINLKHLLNVELTLQNGAGAPGRPREALAPHPQPQPRRPKQGELALRRRKPEGTRDPTHPFLFPRHTDRHDDFFSSLLLRRHHHRG